MNLPAYFLADLPPEAALTPAMVNAACDTLRRNRAKYLLPRSTESMIALLCEVASDWLQPENRFRRLALELGPAETGFSAAVLQSGLDAFFREFTPGNFRRLLAQEVGGALCVTGDDWRAGRESVPAPHASSPAPGYWRGPELLVHIAAGNIPNPSLMSLTLGLLTRSAQFMKCASGAALLPRLFAHSIYHADPKLGACLELAAWRGGNRELEGALFAHADCVTATGSDETLAAVRAQLPSRVRFLGYGHKVSFGFVAREVLREEEIASVISRAADDIVAWNPQGCLSPHVLYVEERGAVESDQFAQRLAVELAQRELAAPRGAIATEEAARIDSQRAIYETIAAHRADAKIWASANSTAWTVVFEHEVTFRFSPLNRFIFVKPVPDLPAVLRGVDELHGRVSTVGLAASPAKAAELAREFAHWGVPRICPLGRMQSPPLTWRHDGRPALGDLILWTDIEL